MFEYEIGMKSNDVKLVEIDASKLKDVIDLAKKENLIIIGDSQKGKTNILKKIISSVSKKSLIIDAFDEINCSENHTTVKYKNGFYNKDYENEITKFAIRQSKKDLEVKTIFYDDFYGEELEEIVDFLNFSKERNVVLTVNNPSLKSGLKMILKGVYYNESIKYNPYELEVIAKHFNKVLFIGEYVEFFNVRIVDGHVVFENI